MNNFYGHYTETALEISEQMQGDLDVFVMGAGTGATIAGVSCFFKEVPSMRRVKIVLADP